MTFNKFSKIFLENFSKPDEKQVYTPWNELPRLENPANTCAWHTKTVGGDHGINGWWDLIRSRQLFNVSVCHAQVFAGFSGHGYSIHNIIPLLKKQKCTGIYTYDILIL